MCVRVVSQLTALPPQWSSYDVGCKLGTIQCKNVCGGSYSYQHSHHIRICMWDVKAGYNRLQRQADICVFARCLLQLWVLKGTVWVRFSFGRVMGVGCESVWELTDGVCAQASIWQDLIAWQVIFIGILIMKL